MSYSLRTDATGKVLMYSTGLDSYCLRQVFEPDVSVYVDMGTPYAFAERQRLAGEGGRVIVHDLRDLGRCDVGGGIIPARNLVLAIIGAMYGDTIAIGGTAGDRILDQRPAFAEKATDILRHLWSPQWWTPGKPEMQVVVPFADMTKGEIVRAFIDAGGDPGELVHRSFSCYEPVHDDTPPYYSRPCGTCKPCLRKWVALAVNGIAWPEVADRARAVLSRDVLPAIRNGSVRGREDHEVLQALELEA